MAMRNKVKEIVDDRGLSVYQFWQQTGISRNTAYDLYNKPGQYPKAEVMEAILKAFNLAPNDVIEQVDD